MPKKVLFEDATMAYNRWVSGIASREFNAQRMAFKDIVSQDSSSYQNPNNLVSNKIIPYQLLNAAKTLASLFVDTDNTLSELRSALKNPVVQEDKKLRREVTHMTAHLESSLKCLKRVLEVVDPTKDSDDDGDGDGDDDIDYRSR